MRRAILAAVAISWMTACQPAPSPRPAGSAAASPTQALVTLRPSPAARASVEPPSPFAEDAYDGRTLVGAVEGFADGLIDQYDGGTRQDLDRLFSEEGLTSAMAYDWRLRGAVREETWFRGEISLRGWSPTREEGLARPPLLETNIGFMVEPGAELVDARSGTVLQRWNERQYFAMIVALRYDAAADLWRATAIAPPVDWFGMDPGMPGPAVRCPGLGPDRPDDADPVDGRAWCFGADGRRAYSRQVSLLAAVPCGQTRSAVLVTGWPIGTNIDAWDRHEFVRDPAGEFHKTWPLALAYDGDARLPDDAYTTGLTDGELEVWVSPAAETTAIWVRHGDRFERWPRAGEWGVTDCN